MPILQTIADLFRAGAVRIAEQFVRGTTTIRSLPALLSDRFGPDFQVGTDDVNSFGNTVLQASKPSAIIQAGGAPDESIIPEWIESANPGGFIQTGLAEVSLSLPTGEELFSTHIPIQFANPRLLKWQEIKDKITKAISSGDGPGADFYEKDIDRIDQAIRYYQELNAKVSTTVNLFSTFRGV